MDGKVVFILTLPVLLSAKSIDVKFLCKENEGEIDVCNRCGYEDTQDITNLLCESNSTCPENHQCCACLNIANLNFGLRRFFRGHRSKPVRRKHEDANYQADQNLLKKSIGEVDGNFDRFMRLLMDEQEDAIPEQDNTTARNISSKEQLHEYLQQQHYYSTTPPEEYNSPMTEIHNTSPDFLVFDHDIDEETTDPDRAQHIDLNKYIYEDIGVEDDSVLVVKPTEIQQEEIDQEKIGPKEFEDVDNARIVFVDKEAEPGAPAKVEDYIVITFKDSNSNEFRGIDDNRTKYDDKEVEIKEYIGNQEESIGFKDSEISNKEEGFADVMGDKVIFGNEEEMFSNLEKTYSKIVAAEEYVRNYKEAEVLNDTEGTSYETDLDKASHDLKEHQDNISGTLLEQLKEDGNITTFTKEYIDVFNEHGFTANLTEHNKFKDESHSDVVIEYETDSMKVTFLPTIVDDASGFGENEIDAGSGSGSFEGFEGSGDMEGSGGSGHWNDYEGSGDMDMERVCDYFNTLTDDEDYLVSLTKLRVKCERIIDTEGSGSQSSTNSYVHDVTEDQVRKTPAEFEKIILADKYNYEVENQVFNFENKDKDSFEIVREPEENQYFVPLIVTETTYGVNVEATKVPYDKEASKQDTGSNNNDINFEVTKEYETLESHDKSISNNFEVTKEYEVFKQSTSSNNYGVNFEVPKEYETLESIKNNYGVTKEYEAGKEGNLYGVSVGGNKEFGVVENNYKAIHGLNYQAFKDLEPVEEDDNGSFEFDEYGDDSSEITDI